MRLHKYLVLNVARKGGASAAATPPLEMAHAGSTTAALMRTPEYWRALCPELHCCDDHGEGGPYVPGSGIARPPPACVSGARSPQPNVAESAARIQGALAREGLAIEPLAMGDARRYLGGPDRQLHEVLAQGVRNLLAAGWPPSAILMYDECWELQRRCQELMHAATGCPPCLDIVCFSVDPRHGAR